MMFTVDQYIKSIQLNLNRHSNVLVEKLKNIFAYHFSTEIHLLDYAAFIEPTRFELSIMMFSMDEEGNEVFYEEADPTVFSGSIEVLPEIEYYALADKLLDSFFDFYEQNEEELAQKEQEVFSLWFKDCWKQAGGQAFNLPTYFGLHDDDQSFDLKNNRWMDDDEKWSY